MSDEEEHGGERNRFERGRSPQRPRSRSRSPRRSGGGGGAPATLFVAEIPAGLQPAELEKLCVDLEARQPPPHPCRPSLPAPPSPLPPPPVPPSLADAQPHRRPPARASLHRRLA